MRLLDAFLCMKTATSRRGVDGHDTLLPLVILSYFLIVFDAYLETRWIQLKPSVNDSDDF
jgi:hypothetical protein